MRMEKGSGAGLAQDMRAEFDRSFAQTVQPAPIKESLMQIRVGQERFVVRVQDTAGIAKPKRILSIPSRIPEMLGLATIEGNIMPVFDLAALLKVGGSGNPTLVLLVDFDGPAGLAFDALELTVQVPVSGEGGSAAGRHVRSLVPVGPAMRPLIDMSGILCTIRRNSADGVPPRE